MQELIKALAKARGEFEEIAKDKVNPHYRNKYASLDAINKAVMPALSKNGLAITQLIEQVETGQALKTVLWHTSGESIESTLVIPQINDMQKLGSALTYARRYSLSAILNVSADEDDDGEASKGNSNNTNQAKTTRPKAVNSNLISDPQKKRLFAIANEHNWETAAVKGMLSQMGFDSSAKVTKAKYEEVCGNLQNAELCQQWNEHMATEEDANKKFEQVKQANIAELKRDMQHA